MLDRYSLLALLLPLLVFAPAVVAGDVGDTPTDKLTCPDSKFTSGGAISNVCWSCMFPITIAGQAAGGSMSDIPDDHASAVCVCPGRSGYPSPGVTFGMWQPAHLFELVRQPWCSPVMGKVLSNGDDNWQEGGGDGGGSSGGGGGSNALTDLSRWGGRADAPESTEEPAQAFYHFHWWVNPANYVINGVLGSFCSESKQSDSDVAYASEIDPTWHDNTLSLYTTPEAKLFANMAAIASCTVDGVASTFYKPVAAMFWCAGTWGSVYPYTGFVAGGDDPPRMTSLLTFRALGALHRRTLAKRVYGDSAVCSAQVAPMILKQQYKMQTFYPIPETNSNHWLGASVFEWGEWRNIPYIGEDFVYVEFRWTECCITAW